MAPVGERFCEGCEVCEATLAGDGAATEAVTSGGGGRGLRHRTCPRCGHPQRWHRALPDGRSSVVAAPLPDALPVALTGPTGPADDPPPAATAGDADVDSEGFVGHIRELAELYRAGLLDDDEFAAAKAIVLRNQRP